ncbi:D-alanyl-D-alanine carboxypeptidase [Streptomyces sp. ISL-112]|uniref:D-alanyl-D-alanine carboxypeptidase family protein n=1 Tax=unclassified Streptomyces TaxID=2593676 RepID=UPI001BEB961C|nr:MULTISPECIES: serine hydrolase [unclassified Streptomyces]MBT2428578.1 D-alanyl-D-alanine carboxypeptidase [Streptomyces sp. ISL-112]MBT2465441.1 D-alanyl-D-alanine carboxypeptidase [Streptomyces sp. ISL-63]
MAGESPDKTEQRKSSGTAAEERDPRCAVFREPGADVAEDAAADEATPDRVASDTATAVFRPRLPEDEAGRAPEESASGEEEPASGEEEPAKAPEGAITPQKPAATSEGPEGSDAAAEAPEGDTDGTSDASDAAAGEPEPGDVRLRAAVAAWVDAAVEGEGEADDKADGPAKGEAKAEPAADADAEPASDSDSETETEAEAELTSVGEPEAEAKTATAAEAEKAESAADSDSDDGEGPAPAAGTGSDLRGIDQPTAVFKAVAPAKRVDQPTTALKLSPQEREELKAAGDKAAGDKAREPESAVERTSTFVPLRSDDVRPAPAPRAPATEAPTGTPDDGSGTPARTPAPTPASAAPSAPAAPSWAAAERTRQQPLPPKPPLDLLAELTNTPPPAETPVRTAVRRVKIWTPLVLLLLIVFAIVQVMRPLPEPVLELTAKPTYTFEGGGTKLSWPGQGQSAVMVDGVGSLGTEGAQKPAPIASVAKVMTAHVILQAHPLKDDEEGETITVDQKAEDESKRPEESTAPLTKGQQLTQRQMLQLLMIPSGNNAARLLARWDAGSEDAFIDKMNDAAKDLGMTNSTYTDPSGLEKTTVSTATDQLKLAQAVMRNEVFREVVDMPEIEIKGIVGKIYNNNNLLLQDGVSGIKTGSSTPAGGNLLWSANTKVDGKVLWIYGAVMGQQAGTGRLYDSLELSLQNSLKLIKDAQEAPTSATVVKKGDVVGYVDNGFGARTPVIATKNLKAVGWPGLEVELKVTDNGKGIAHSAKAGSEVGMVTVGTGSGKVTAPVVLQGDLTEPAFGDKLTRIG